ncbi:branched-chain amino acid ABC transporter permease [bacterium]|nr:branched-chain amino acid ABC transporter permease [bacterium]
MFWQLVAGGFAMGSLYALIALAFVLVYKTSEVINFAQGEIGMAATFVAWMLMTRYDMSFGLALAGAIAFAAFLGAGFEFAVLRRADKPTLLGLIVLTLGFEMILYAGAGMVFGTDVKAFESPISETTTYEFAGVVVNQLEVVIIAVSLVLMALLFAFFRFTRLGLAMMATSQNPTAARIMGIRVPRVHATAWAIASMLGAVTGVLIAPKTLLDPNMMIAPMLKAFAAAVLGGLTSLPGAVIGGWILGITENLFGGYVSPEFKSSFAFLVIVLVLCVRPSGLFKTHRKKKV